MEGGRGKNIFLEEKKCKKRKLMNHHTPPFLAGNSWKVVAATLIIALSLPLSLSLSLAPLLPKKLSHKNTNMNIAAGSVQIANVRPLLKVKGKFSPKVRSTIFWYFAKASYS